MNKLADNEIVISPEQMIVVDPAEPDYNTHETLGEHFEESLKIFLEECEIVNAALHAREVFEAIEFDYALDKDQVEPIEKDDFSHVSGHFTRTEGYTQDVTPVITLTIKHPSALLRAGLDQEEWQQFLSTEMENIDVCKEDDVEVDVGPGIARLLSSVQQQRLAHFEQGYVALPRDLDVPFLENEHCQGMPDIPIIAKATVYSAELFDLPVYHAHPGMFVPEHLQAVPIDEARTLLSGKVLAFEESRTLVKHDFLRHLITEDLFSKKMVDALTHRGGEPGVEPIFARIMATVAKSPTHAVELALGIAQAADRQGKLSQLTTLGETSALTGDAKKDCARLTSALSGSVEHNISNVLHSLTSATPHDRVNLVNELEMSKREQDVAPEQQYDSPKIT